MRVEVVEFGGESFRRAGATEPGLDSLAGLFAQAGRILVPIRPFLARFPLQPDQGQNLHPGRLPDGRQVLFAHNRDSTEPVVFAHFDAEGNLVDARQADDPGCCQYYEDYSVWLAREFGYQPCLIWMREFRTHRGLGVQLLPDSGVEDFSPGELWSWLQEGKYAINWCDYPWASRRSGEITDN
jgi:hypothetical protein